MIIGITLLLIGVGALLQQLGYISVNTDLLWPIIFIVLGLKVLFFKKGHGWHGHGGGWEKHKKKK